MWLSFWYCFKFGVSLLVLAYVLVVVFVWALVVHKHLDIKMCDQRIQFKLLASLVTVYMKLL